MKYHYFYRAVFKTQYKGTHSISGVLAAPHHILCGDDSWRKTIEIITKTIKVQGFKLYGEPQVKALSFLHATEDE